MKSLIVLAGLVFATSTASAEKFYRCDIVATNKTGYIFDHDTVAYLSNHRYSKIKFTNFETTLAIKVEHDGKLHGWVNGQRNFILNGTYQNGIFESANATGTIKCSEGQEEKSMLQRRNETLVKQTEPKGQWWVMTAASTAYLYCFIGNGEDMAAQLQATVPGVKSVKNNAKQQKIVLTQTERRCLEGTGDRDDFECTRYDITRDYNYDLLSCDRDYPGDDR